MVVEICKREAVHGSVGEPASLDNHTQYIIRDDHGRVSPADVFCVRSSVFSYLETRSLH